MSASKLRFPVLRVYFKVIKSNLPSLLIYLFIFMAIAVLFTLFGSGAESGNFQDTKSSVAFFDYDNTPLTNGLRQSISRNVTFVPIKDSTTALSDALFFHDVQYVVRIPKGFTAKLLKGESAKIEKTVGQDQTSGEYVDLSIKRYLSIARVYAKELPGISQKKLVGYVKGSVSKTTAVTTKSYGSNVGTLYNANYLFRYLAYIFIIIIFMGVTSIMMSFNGTEIRMRNLVSPMNSTAFSIQIFTGHACYTLVVWVVGILLSLMLYGAGLIGTGFALLCLNLLCFSVACLSLAFLIGNFVQNRGAQNGIGNVLSLGLAFISGIFIPQNLLSPSLLNVAHFTPSFWYIKAADGICALSSYNAQTLSPIFQSMLIELGFAVALFAVAMAIIRQKKRA